MYENSIHQNKSRISRYLPSQYVDKPTRRKPYAQVRSHQNFISRVANPFRAQESSSLSDWRWECVPWLPISRSDWGVNITRVLIPSCAFPLIRRLTSVTSEFCVHSQYISTEELILLKGHTGYRIRDYKRGAAEGIQEMRTQYFQIEMGSGLGSTTE
jgi:hypothetical protein